MKTCTIFNAASGAADQTRQVVVGLADQSGSIVLTVSDEQTAETVLTEAGRHGCQRVIVVGGDGTISQILNDAGAARADFEWAVVPAGTGNDLARSLAIPLDDLPQAWQIAVENTAVEVDMIRMDNKEREWFINAANGGFGGKVANDVLSEDKQRWGALAYWMTALAGLTDIHAYQVTLELDDRTMQLPLVGLAVANGRFVGGGFPIAPTAALNDGKLDVSVVSVLPTTELFTAGLNFTLGRHDAEERVATYRSTRVQVRSNPAIPFSIDGEPFQAMNATFEIVPAALHLVAGPEAPAIE